jgi:hypothetical protein
MKPYCKYILSVFILSIVNTTSLIAFDLSWDNFPAGTFPYDQTATIGSKTVRIQAVGISGPALNVIPGGINLYLNGDNPVVYTLSFEATSGPLLAANEGFGLWDLNTHTPSGPSTAITNMAFTDMNDQVINSPNFSTQFTVLDPIRQSVIEYNPVAASITFGQIITVRSGLLPLFNTIGKDIKSISFQVSVPEFNKGEGIYYRLTVPEPSTYFVLAGMLLTVMLMKYRKYA